MSGSGSGRDWISVMRSQARWLLLSDRRRRERRRRSLQLARVDLLVLGPSLGFSVALFSL